MKGKLRLIYLGSFMNHRPSFKVTREDFESDASIRNAVTNTKQIGDRCSMNKTLRYLLLKVKERARTFPVTCNFVQLYICIYVSQEWEAFVDLPTFIQYLFRLDKQRNIFENCTHASNVNVWYKREFSKLFSSSWLFIYIIFNLLFVEKVDYRVDFYKNISDSPEDIKDERWPNS